MMSISSTPLKALRYLAKFLVVFQLAIGLSITLNAQNQFNINNYPIENHDSLYYELFKNWWTKDQDLALTYARKALELSRKHNNVDIMLKSINAIGLIYLHKNSYDSALFYNRKALEFAIKFKKQDREMYAYSNLGNIYLNLGKIDQSLDFSFKALKLAKKLGIEENKVTSLNNLGFAYAKAGDNNEALNYYQKCLTLAKTYKPELIATLKTNIAFIYINQEKYDQAKSLFEAVLEKAETDQSQIDAYYGLASIYLKRSKFDNAKLYTDKALQLSKKTLDRYFVPNCYMLLGEIAYKENAYDKAIKYFQTALLEADTIQSPFIKQDIYQLLSQVYESTDDFKRSREALSQAYILKDSLFSKEFAENFKNVHLKLAKEESDEVIHQKELQIQKQKMISYLIGTVAFFTIVLAFLLWRGILFVKRSRNELAVANNTINHQNKELTRFNKNLERLVDERTMDLQLSLDSISKLNDQLDDFISKTSKEVREPIASLQGLCHVALADIQDHPRAIHYFHEFNKTTQSLSKIFKRLVVVNQINRAGNFNERIKFYELISEIVRFEKSRSIPKHIDIQAIIDPEVSFLSDKRIIRLILENLINNAFKFYDPSESVQSFIQVKVKAEDRNLKLCVIDNGIGLDGVSVNKIFQLTKSSTFTNGVSLYLTKLACERLGGNIILDFTPEGYTMFVITLPMEKPIMEQVALN